MIVPNQFFEVKVSRKNIEHYLSLGYNVDLRDIISVPPEHLPRGSHQKILIAYDCCGEIFNRQYKNHLKIKDGGDYCKKCLKKCKTQKTILEKYGVECPLSLKEIREKGHRTNLERYGVYWGMQNPEIAERSRSSWLKKNNEKCSKQQLYVYELLKKIYCEDKIKINYAFRSFSFDIALFYGDNVKIDIEYDGYYWHSDQQKDRRRDEVSKSYGWKILRIKGGHSLPIEEQLMQAINKLINGYSYTEIKLDDWKEDIAA